MSTESLGGRYRIVRHLARGGMAEVYLAHDDLLDRAVAVKVMFAELARDPSFVERFRREARSAALLNHPNIVSVYDFGEDPQGYFIVMEFVAGQTLSEVIANEAPMAPARAIGVAADIAAALSAAHHEGIVHRDVKPANVLMADGVTKVTDFGIARAVDANEGLTVPGMVIGTTSYLSPEQAQGMAVDYRTDLYALGMVLYKMLTGILPFTGDNLIAVATKQLQERPAPPSTVNPAVPPRLDAVVAKALAVNPADRQQTAQELRAELLASTTAAPELPATAAMGPPATAVMPVAPVPTGTVTPAAYAATSMLPSPPGPDIAGASGTGATTAPPTEPGLTPDRPNYRRRRLAALGLVALLGVGFAVAVAALLGGGGTKTNAPPASPLVGATTTTATPSTTNSTTGIFTPTTRFVPTTVPVTASPPISPPTSLTTVPLTTIPVTTIPVTTTPVTTVPTTTKPGPTAPPAPRP